jgi:hypothetical protein
MDELKAHQIVKSLNRSVKPKLEWTDEEFQAYATVCCQPDWQTFKAALIKEAVEELVWVTNFVDSMIREQQILDQIEV